MAGAKAGIICENCKGSLQSELFPGDPQQDLGKEGVFDLAMVGSPCNPFSTQRTKRFSDGNVKEHHLYSVTSDSSSAQL